jgi:hypothetical protein
MTFYTFVLAAHSYVRWAVLALALAVLARAAIGWRRARPWTTADERTHVAFVAVVDTQLLLGLALYVFASPLSRAFVAAPSAALKDAVLRFFGLEHPVLMLSAVIVVHAGRALSRRKHRHRRAAISVALALALVLAGIPWPSLRHGRPLLRVSEPRESAPVRARPGSHDIAILPRIVRRSTNAPRHRYRIFRPSRPRGNPGPRLLAQQ